MTSFTTPEGLLQFWVLPDLQHLRDQKKVFQQLECQPYPQPEKVHLLQGFAQVP